MRAGKLRKRVAVQTLTTSQDGYGEPVETWATVDTVWAELTPAVRATRESFAGMSEQRSAHTTFECRIRFIAGLDPYTTRLLHDGVVYEVESIMDPDGRTRELLMLCYRRE